MIKKVSITNYKLFSSFVFTCNAQLNIIVGDNEAGKSTILEAINLALSRRLNGRLIDADISPHLFNKDVVRTYLDAVKAGRNPDLPRIAIEVFLDDRTDLQVLRGNNNGDSANCCGVRLEIAFDEDYRREYGKLLENPERMETLPTEYYRVSWYSFAYGVITSRSLPVRISYVDAANIRLQGGTDYYLQNIINSGLDPKERVGLAIAYRRLKEHFAGEPAIKEINERMTERRGAITDKELSVAIDLSQRGSWETSLTPHLDDVPYSFVGKGEQNALKIMLALDRQVDTSHIVLIEEPENHLSFSSMALLMSKIAARCDGKQIFITTHSAYVLNKLGIEHVVLLYDRTVMFLTELSNATQNYFRKLSGYDTLRLILSKRTILVEGPSDELIVQKAYHIRHGKLPSADGVDVISMRGLSFARFLDIAKLLRINTAIVTDNDGDHDAVVERYSAYSTTSSISLHVDSDNALVTLEDHLVDVNELGALNSILGTSHESKEALLHYMKTDKNKTECALKFFDATLPVAIPDYVNAAVA